MVEFNASDLQEVISQRIKDLDQARLELARNNLIKTLFDESIGAYLETQTTVTLLNRWIDHHFPRLDGEILDLIHTQPPLQHQLHPFLLEIREMRSKLEKERNLLKDQLQRNPVEVIFSEYSINYYNYTHLLPSTTPEETAKLERELTQLMDRFRQLFAKIQKGYSELLTEIGRFHNSLDSIRESAPIIQRQIEEYELLEKAVNGMITLQVN